MVFFGPFFVTPMPALTEVVAQERTRNYLRQIRGAVVYRAMAVFASFLTIPLMIRYLGQEQFGVWSTLLTILSWALFFDLGIGHGMRNKVAEALASDRTAEARHFIASGYTLIGLIAPSIWVLVITSSHYIPWQTVFNTQAISESTLRETVQITASLLLFNFWIGLISALLGAIQRTSLVAFGQLVSNLLIFLFVFLLSRATDASIESLALVYGLSLVTANIFLSVWFYRQHPDLRPHFSLEKSHLSPLLTLGLQFFVLQLAYLIIFTTDKMMITQLFDPQHVTEYDIVFKLFSLITFAYGLISGPLWSAYTDAYHRNDTQWIRNMLYKQLFIFGGIIIVTCFLMLLTKPIVAYWIGDDFHVSSQLVIAMGAFTLIYCWNNIYAIIVNGIGIIKLQVYTAIAGMIINIPLSIFFAKTLDLGVSGIVLGTISSLLLGAVALPLQVHALVRPITRGCAQ